MDIKGAEDKVTQVDSLLTTVKTTLRKHWGIILIILGVWFVYWATTSEPEPVTNDTEIVYEDSLYEDDEYTDELLVESVDSLDI